MYQGKNPKAIQSRKMIAHATIELMHSKRFEKLNIKEICEKALLSRQTFYSLFDSKEEVIEYIIMKTMDGFQKQLNTNTNLHIDDIFFNLASYVIEKKVLLSLLIRNNMNYLLHKVVQRNILLLREVADITPYNSNEDIDDYHLAFFSSSLAELMITYLRRDDKYSPKELGRLFSDIFTGKYLSIKVKKYS